MSSFFLIKQRYVAYNLEGNLVEMPFSDNLEGKFSDSRM